MAAFTSKATGNWSASGQTTWNEVGVPGDGDTVTIGAHTITVDVNTTVGTSPNNTTTKVIDMTSASSQLVIAAGITLTVKGNIGHVNGCTHTQQAGSTVTFDNSGSGGSPVYTFINGGFSNFNFNGSSGQLATIQAISGQRASMGVPIASLVATFGTFRRLSQIGTTNNVTTLNLSDCLFDTCDRLRPSSTTDTCTIIFDRCTFTAGLHSTDDVTLNTSVARTSGTRRISGCVFSKILTYGASKDFTVTNNYFGNGVAPLAGATTAAFRSNFCKFDGSINGNNGAIWPFSSERNYFVCDNSGGNPHWLSPTALLGTNNTIAQSVFESQAPDLIDVGDALILNGSATSGGYKVISRNNIVLPSGYNTDTVSSGTLLTLYSSTTALFEGYRNTGNVNNTTVGGVGKRGMFAFAEAGNGGADQITALKSNIAWGSTSGQGFLGERVQGNVKDHITAANADKNWTYNTSSGDNQRSYEDKVANNTLWTAGDAVAASVDANQGTGNPQFYDSARNIKTWTIARGYGSTYSDGLTALQAAPSRVADLIAYVFEGFRPANASCRNAAHDGGCVGAANFYKSTRKTNRITQARAALSAFGVS